MKEVGRCPHFPRHTKSEEPVSSCATCLLGTMAALVGASRLVLCSFVSMAKKVAAEPGVGGMGWPEGPERGPEHVPVPAAWGVLISCGSDPMWGHFALRK